MYILCGFKSICMHLLTSLWAKYTPNPQHVRVVFIMYWYWSDNIDYCFVCVVEAHCYVVIQWLWSYWAWRRSMWPKHSSSDTMPSSITPQSLITAVSRLMLNCFIPQAGAPHKHWWKEATPSHAPPSQLYHSRGAPPPSSPLPQHGWRSS